jgi:transposase
MFWGILLWVARTRSSWRKMPEKFGNWTTAYRRNDLWVKRAPGRASSEHWERTGQRNR